MSRFRILKTFITLVILLIIIMPKVEYASSESSSTDSGKIMLGDINDDKVINNIDLIAMLRHISATNTKKHSEWLLEGDKLKAANVTQKASGKIDSTDTLKLLRYIAANNNTEILKNHEDWLTFEKVDSPEKIEVNSIELNKNRLELEEGQDEKLIAIITPNDATDKKIEWKTENDKIAKVDNEGKVTGIEEGLAEIIAKVGEKEDRCKVEVREKKTKPENNTTNTTNTTNTVTPTPSKNEIKAQKVTLNKTKETIKKGETLKLTATVEPNNATDKEIKWNSSDEKIATVEKGKVKTKKTGNVTITAMLKSNKQIKAECKIQVIQEVKEVKLNKTSLKIAKGKSSTLKATISPNDATNKDAEWSTSNKKVVTVDKKGKIKAKGVGTAKVTVKSKNGKKDTCNVKVVQLVKKVKLNKTSLELKEGKTETLKATISPNNATNKELEWTSSNTKIATVNAKGKITAKKKGTVTIIAKAKDGSGKVAKCKVKVIEKKTYQGVELQKNATYHVCSNPLTKSMGVKHYKGHKETYYSQKKLPGNGLTKLNNNGRHVADDGTIRDKDGYIAIAANYLKQGAKIMTSRGPGKVYDTGGMTGKWIDLYVNW